MTIFSSFWNGDSNLERTLELLECLGLSNAAFTPCFRQSMLHANNLNFFSCCIFFLVIPGLTLKGDEDGCGCVVKSVLKGGAVGLDGRIGVGDHIVAANDESMIGLSGHRAR